MAGAWFVLALFLIAIIAAAGKIFLTFYLPRYVSITSTQDDAPALNAPVSAHQDAETAKPATTATPTPAAPQLDVTALRREAKAEALGAILAYDLLRPGERTRAMRAVFGEISGDAYSKAKGGVDRAEAAVRATLPPPAPPATPPRVITVSAGRPEARTLALDEPTMEPLP